MIRTCCPRLGCGPRTRADEVRYPTGVQLRDRWRAWWKEQRFGKRLLLRTPDSQRPTLPRVIPRMSRRAHRSSPFGGVCQGATRNVTCSREQTPWLSPRQHSRRGCCSPRKARPGASCARWLRLSRSRCGLMAGFGSGHKSCDAACAVRTRLRFRDCSLSLAVPAVLLLGPGASRWPPKAR
jgi:hypothetical protein